MILARISTGSYEFETLAETKEEADLQLLAAYYKHVKQYEKGGHEIHARLMAEYIHDHAVNYLTVELGDAFRDGSKIK